MSRDHRHPTACQKQRTQNEPVGLVDIATGAEVLVMMDLEDMKGPQMSHHLSETTQTEISGLTSRHSYQGGDACDGDPGHV